MHRAFLRSSLKRPQSELAHFGCCCCCCCSTQRAHTLRTPKHRSHYHNGRRCGRHNPYVHRPLIGIRWGKRRRRPSICCCCCCCSTQRAQPPDPQAREPLSLWMEAAAAVQHNARTHSGPPSTGATITMDGGVLLLFNTTRTLSGPPSCGCCCCSTQCAHSPDPQVTPKHRSHYHHGTLRCLAIATLARRKRRNAAPRARRNWARFEY